MMTKILFLYLVNIRMYPKLIWLRMGVQQRQRKVISQFNTLCKKRRMSFSSNAKYKNMKSVGGGGGEREITAQPALCFTTFTDSKCLSIFFRVSNAKKLKPKKFKYSIVVDFGHKLTHTKPKGICSLPLSQVI